MSDTEIPESWLSVSLSDICQINPKVKLDDDLDVGFMPMSNVPKVFFGKPSYEVRKWNKVKKGYTQFKDNDTLFAKITPCFENSKATVVSEFPNGWGAGSTEYYVLRPFEGLVDTRLLFALVKTKGFLINGAANMSGSVGHRRVPKDFVENYKFSLMPLAEQKQIATKLDQLLSQVNTLKNRLDKIPSTLKRFRQSVLAAAVSGKLTEEWRGKNIVSSLEVLLSEINDEREILKSKKHLKKSYGIIDDPEPLFESLPKSWKWLSFNHIAVNDNHALKAGPFGSALKKSDCVTTGFKVYGQEQVIAGDEKLVTYFVDEKKYEQLKSCSVKAGDILISLVGTIGKVLVLSENSEIGIINPRLVKLSLNKKISRDYINYYLNSLIAKDFFKGFSHGGTMDILNLGILKQLPIALPPVEEQTEIVRQVEKFFTFTDQIEKQINAAQARVNNLTQSILAKAFRGELTAEWREQNTDLINGENSAESLLEKIRKERESLKPAKKIKKIMAA